jgi:hypothetical protein
MNTAQCSLTPTNSRDVDFPHEVCLSTDREQISIGLQTDQVPRKSRITAFSSDS